MVMVPRSTGKETLSAKGHGQKIFMWQAKIRYTIGKEDLSTKVNYSMV